MNYREEDHYREQVLFLAYNMVAKHDEDTWLLDTGYTNNMIDNNKLLSSLDHSYKSSINLGDEYSLEVVEKGDMVIQKKVQNKKVKYLCFS